MGTTRTYSVVGMTCGHCAQAVREEVGKVAGVLDVRVDLASGQVTVESDRPVDALAFEAAVDDAGYQVAS
jgi:copper ion binding protein